MKSQLFKQNGTLLHCQTCEGCFYAGNEMSLYWLIFFLVVKVKLLSGVSANFLMSFHIWNYTEIYMWYSVLSNSFQNDFLISLFYTRCILYEFQYILIIRRGCICKNKVVLKHEILRESQYNIFITEGRISALFCNFFTSVFTVA